jgi:hypothetical protein
MNKILKDPGIQLRSFYIELAKQLGQNFSFKQIADFFFKYGIIEQPENPYPNYKGSKQAYALEKLGGAKNNVALLRALPEIIFYSLNGIEGDEPFFDVRQIEWIMKEMGYQKTIEVMVDDEDRAWAEVTSYEIPENLSEYFIVNSNKELESKTALLSKSNLSQVVGEELIGSAEDVGEGVFSYVKSEILRDVEVLEKRGFNVKKTKKLIEELNHNFKERNYYSVGANIRAILDHLPPSLGYKNFDSLVSSYKWSPTDKKYVQKLLEYKEIAHDSLHRQISEKEDLLSMENVPDPLYLNRFLQECFTSEYLWKDFKNQFKESKGILTRTVGRVKIKISEEGGRKLLISLRELIEKNPGNTRVTLLLPEEEGFHEMNIVQRVDLTNELESDLKKLLGNASLEKEF